jgi:peptide subunit release factor 1 (eRF1)
MKRYDSIVYATCPRGHYGEWGYFPDEHCPECGEPMDIECLRDVLEKDDERKDDA